MASSWPSVAARPGTPRTWCAWASGAETRRAAAARTSAGGAWRCAATSWQPTPTRWGPLGRRANGCSACLPGRPRPKNRAG
eukprot:6442761-Lingulodinium_polyedra.AAC.1